MPIDDALYRRERERHYPNTKTNFLPKESDADKRMYKEMQDRNTTARDNYFGAEKDAKDYVEGRPELEKDYYKAYSDSVLPSAHRRLEPLAGQLGDAEYR